MKPFISFVLAFVVLSPSMSAFASKEKDRKILPEDQFRKLSEQSSGRILPETELPLLREALSNPLQRLHQALKTISRERIGVTIDIPAEFWIQDTHQVNAFMSVVETASGEKKAIWALTTGIVKTYFDQFPGDSQSALKALIGVLAHEIAHTLDFFDPNGIQNTHDQTSTGGIINPNDGLQAIELRTDIEAINLLREAQLPDDSLLEGLKTLQSSLSSSRKKSSAISSYFSTHPDDQMRLSAQRIALTALRFKRGEKPLIENTIPSGILTEIAALRPAEVQYIVPGEVFPPTILETVQELHVILAGVVPDEMKDGGGQEYAWTHNRPRNLQKLYTHLIQLLIDRVENLTAEEQEAVIDLNLSIVDPEIDFPKDAFASDEHIDLMNRVELFQTEEYRAALQEKAHLSLVFEEDTAKSSAGGFANLFTNLAPNAKPKGIKALSSMLKRFGFVSSEETFRAATKDALASALVEWMESEPEKSKFSGLDRFSETQSGYGTEFAPFFHENVLPQLSPEVKTNWIMTYLETRPGEAHCFLNMRYKASESSPNILRESLIQGRKQLLGKLSSDLRNRYAVIANSLWQDRGRLAVLDMITQNHTDWLLIFELLEISESEGIEDLNRALKDFTTSAEYPSFLSQLVQTSLVESIDHKKVDLHWAGDDLYPYLAGEHNPALLEQEVETQIAQILIAGGYLEKKPAVKKRLYKEHLTEALDRRGNEDLSIEEFRKVNSSVVIGLKKYDQGSSVSKFTASVIDDLAQVLAQSNLTSENKRTLLREVFITRAKKFDLPLQWYNDLRNSGLVSQTKKVIIELLKTDAVDSYAEFFDQGVFPKNATPSPTVTTDLKFATIVALHEEISEELHQIESLPSTQASQSFERLLQATVGQAASIDWENEEYARDRIQAQIDSPEWYTLKNAFAESLTRLPLDPALKIRAFQLVTLTGGTPHTDSVFEEAIFPLTQAEPSLLVDILKAKSISNSLLRVRLARIALESEVSKLEGRSVSKEDYQRFLDSLNELASHDSAERDHFIEETLWRLHIEDPEIVQLAQDAKSTNWRKANPKTIQWLSTHGSLTNDLTPDQRLRLADYLADPMGKPFPAGIEAVFDRRFEEAEGEIGGFIGESSVAQARERYRLAGKNQINSFARESTPNEKIPVIEMLFTAGDAPLMTQPHFPERLIREHLGYTPGSVPEKVLLSYLRSLPPQERSVTLAFLLSRKGEKGSGLKPIFEVFQTVGIKAGQLGALWKLFGTEASDELRDLKDNASPMEKAEILRIMRETLSPQELSQISHLKALIGSASIKAVILLQLENGQEGVMMLRRPFAAEQIHSNLARARGFLTELKKTGVEFDYLAMNAMIDTVEDQLADEILFTQEAKNIAQAHEIFEHFNDELAKDLDGWRFKVPQVLEGFGVYDNLLFVEKADGTTLNQVPQSPEREKVSKIVVTASFRGLFRQGWFNADGHAGNWLMNSDTRVIYPIDFGQAETFEKSGLFFRADEIYHLAQFLKATLAKNKSSIIKHGLALTETRAPTPSQRQRLEHAVSAVLSRPLSLEDRALSLVSAFSESDLKIMRKVSFGALKGLVTLEQEKFVSTEEFNQMTRKEVTRILLRKAPLLVLDKMKSAVKACQRYFSSTP